MALILLTDLRINMDAADIESFDASTLLQDYLKAFVDPFLLISNRGSDASSFGYSPLLVQVLQHFYVSSGIYLASEDKDLIAQNRHLYLFARGWNSCGKTLFENGDASKYVTHVIVQRCSLFMNNQIYPVVHEAHEASILLDCLNLLRDNNNATEGIPSSFQFIPRLFFNEFWINANPPLRHRELGSIVSTLFDPSRRYIAVFMPDKSEHMREIFGDVDVGGVLIVAPNFFYHSRHSSTEAAAKEVVVVRCDHEKRQITPLHKKLAIRARDTIVNLMTFVFISDIDISRSPSRRGLMVKARASMNTWLSNFKTVTPKEVIGPTWHSRGNNIYKYVRFRRMNM